MTKAIVAKKDEASLRQLAEKLPQALLLVAEAGLDSEKVIEGIIKSEPSDVFSISPQEKKKTIGVGQVRDFITAVRTYATKRRVCLFKPAEAMTEEAQNALLKILEEPSAGLHLILVASSTEGILPTITSRCQIVTLNRTSNRQDRAILELSDLDDQAKQQVLFLASGRPALIRQLISNPKLLDKYRQLAADAKTIISGTTYVGLAAAQRHSADRDGALKLVDVILTMLRFQIKKHGSDQKAERLLSAAHHAEQALRANGNIKLALLQLAVR